jgi:hypothetical protein
MNATHSVAREASEDIYFGQVVINWARWFLIAASVVLVLWTSASEVEAALAIVPIVGLMAVNFYLHGRYLAERPANPVLIAVASLLDIVVVTTVVLTWSDQRGLASEFYLMYYPVALAIAFVLRPRISIGYTVAVLAAYGIACFVTDPAIVEQVATTKLLLIRLITLGATGGLAAYYFRIQRNHRRTIVQSEAKTDSKKQP